jgi:hypothetical protein
VAKRFPLVLTLSRRVRPITLQEDKVPKYRFDGDLMACSIDDLTPFIIGEAQGDQEMPPCRIGFVSVRRQCQLRERGGTVLRSSS